MLKEKGTTEDEMAGWRHWLDGCESGWTPGVGDGQGGLACCDSWGRSQTRLSDWTELKSVVPAPQKPYTAVGERLAWEDDRLKFKLFMILSELPNMDSK